MTAPARFWHRYAAWSLDAALVALVATPFVAGRIATAAHALDRDLLTLLTDFYRQLAAALGDAAVPSSSLTALAGDPAVRHGIAAVQLDVLHLAGPPVLAFVLIGTAYHVITEGSRRQASVGKRVLGLRVVDANGNGVSHGRALLRHAAGALSWLSLNIGHLMAAAPPQRRSLHDRIAATHVVADRPMPGWARAWLGLQAVAALAATIGLAAHWSGLVQTALQRALG